MGSIYSSLWLDSRAYGMLWYAEEADWHHLGYRPERLCRRLAVSESEIKAMRSSDRYPRLISLDVTRRRVHPSGLLERKESSADATTGNHRWTAPWSDGEATGRRDWRPGEGRFRWQGWREPWNRRTTAWRRWRREKRRRRGRRRRSRDHTWSSRSQGGSACDGWNWTRADRWWSDWSNVCSFSSSPRFTRWNQR